MMQPSPTHPGQHQARQAVGGMQQTVVTSGMVSGLLAVETAEPKRAVLPAGPSVPHSTASSASCQTWCCSGVWGVGGCEHFKGSFVILADSPDSSYAVQLSIVGPHLPFILLRRSSQDLTAAVPDWAFNVALTS